MNYKYAIVSPVKNEEKYLEKTIDSVLNQIVKAQRWIIINDNSTDSTGEIIQKFMSRFNWIHVINNSEKQQNSVRRMGGQAVLHLGLDKLNVKSSQAVFVGDDWLVDIIGAEKAQLQPIWLQHHLVHRKWPHHETSVPIIKSLNEIRQQISTAERSLS